MRFSNEDRALRSAQSCLAPYVLKKGDSTQSVLCPSWGSMHALMGTRYTPRTQHHHHIEPDPQPLTAESNSSKPLCLHCPTSHCESLLNSPFLSKMTMHKQRKVNERITSEQVSSRQQDKNGMIQHPRGFFLPIEKVKGRL